MSAIDPDLVDETKQQEQEDISESNTLQKRVQLDVTAGEPASKRYKKTGGGQLADAVNRMVEEMEASRKQREYASITPLDRALALLENGSGIDLEDEEFVRAVDIMQAGSNALIFIKLSSAKREIWLEKMLSSYDTSI